MSRLVLFCVTNKELRFLEKLNLNLVGVGKKNFSKRYVTCIKGKNIQSKEKNYSELTFIIGFENKLKDYHQNDWIGFCQKRRFWLKSDRKISNFKDLKKNLLKKPDKIWNNYESIICKSIRVDNPKKMKMIKRGWINIIKNPKILFNNKYHNIQLHFDMHHGYGVIDKAINELSEKDKEDFKIFLKKKKFNPHIMFISKKKIINKWFNDLFKWLFKCEKIFGLNLKGYDQERLYAYLAERYLSYWFTKYTKHTEWPWTFFEDKQIK